MRSSGKRKKSAADPARKIRDCSSVWHGKASPKAAVLFSAARIVLRNSLSWSFPRKWKETMRFRKGSIFGTQTESFGCTDMRMILHIGFPEQISLHLKKSLRPAPTNPLCKIQKANFFLKISLPSPPFLCYTVSKQTVLHLRNRKGRNLWHASGTSTPPQRAATA